MAQEFSLGSLYVLRSVADLNRNISKYVLKNLPKGLPKVSRFISNYLEALLGSDNVNDSFVKLDAYNGDGVSQSGFKFIKSIGVFDGVVWGECGESEDALEVLNWVQEDSLHFILRDFCSSVGVVYKPEYREPILRSFVGKTIPYFRWLFSDFMHFPVEDIVIRRNGAASEFSLTDVGDVTDAFPVSPITDSFSHVFVNLQVFLSADALRFDLVKELNLYKELLSLVLPARVSLSFF